MNMSVCIKFGPSSLYMSRLVGSKAYHRYAYAYMRVHAFYVYTALQPPYCFPIFSDAVRLLFYKIRSACALHHYERCMWAGWGIVVKVWSTGTWHFWLTSRRKCCITVVFNGVFFGGMTINIRGFSHINRYVWQYVFCWNDVSFSCVLPIIYTL